MQCLVLCSLQTMTKTVMAQFVLWNVRQKCNGIKSRWNFKIRHLKNAAIQIDRNETNPQGGTGPLAAPPPESLEPLTWVTTANTNETTQTDTGNLHIQSSADWFCDLRVGQTCQKGGNIDKRHTAWVHSTSLVDVTTFLTSLQRDTGCLHCKGRQTVHCKGKLSTLCKQCPHLARQSDFCQRCYSKQPIRRNDTHSNRCKCCALN